MLAGSASLERKNKLQVHNREFSPQDKPWGQLECPTCGWEGFLRDDYRRVLGPPDGTCRGFGT